jgi:hypothetical protein
MAWCPSRQVLSIEIIIGQAELENVLERAVEQGR